MTNPRLGEPLRARRHEQRDRRPPVPPLKRNAFGDLELDAGGGLSTSGGRLAVDPGHPLLRIAASGELTLATWPYALAEYEDGTLLHENLDATWFQDADTRLTPDSTSVSNTSFSEFDDDEMLLAPGRWRVSVAMTLAYGGNVDSSHALVALTDELNSSNIEIFDNTQATYRLDPSASGDQYAAVALRALISSETTRRVVLRAASRTAGVNMAVRRTYLEAEYLGPYPGVN